MASNVPRRAAPDCPLPGEAGPAQGRPLHVSLRRSPISSCVHSCQNRRGEELCRNRRSLGSPSLLDPGGTDSESDPGSHRGVGAALPAGPASGGRGLLVNATRAWCSPQPDLEPPRAAGQPRLRPGPPGRRRGRRRIPGTALRVSALPQKLAPRGRPLRPGAGPHRRVSCCSRVAPSPSGSERARTQKQPPSARAEAPPCVSASARKRIRAPLHARTGALESRQPSAMGINWSLQSKTSLRLQPQLGALNKK